MSRALDIAAQCRESASAWAREIDTRLQAADELERLERVNAELLGALMAFSNGGPPGGEDFQDWHESYFPAIAVARAAIASAKEAS